LETFTNKKFFLYIHKNIKNVFNIYGSRVMVRVRIRFSVWLVSVYAHIFYNVALKSRQAIKNCAKSNYSLPMRIFSVIQTQNILVLMFILKIDEK